LLFHFSRVQARMRRCYDAIAHRRAPPLSLSATQGNKAFSHK
jgi:hypothetical protein